MKTKLKILSAALLLSTGLASAQIASDSADNYVSWTNGSNGGSGFDAWSFDINGGTGFAGAFVGNPADAGISGMNALSFGLFSNPAGTGATVSVRRSFATALSVGDTFQFQMGMNWDSNSSGNKGFNLYSDGTELININMANSAAITLNASPMLSNYGSQAMDLSFTLLSPTQLQVNVSGRDGVESFNDTLTISGPVNNFSFYSTEMDSGVERQIYFNNLEIIPEPGTALLLLGGLALLAFFKRRRG